MRAERLNDLLQLQREVRHIHPLLDRHYPVVLADGNQLRVFEWERNRYRQTTTYPDAYDLPTGVRAAFPLQELGGRTACVVSTDALDSLEGQVFVLHEFVHCYQAEAGRLELQRTLGIAREAAEARNHAWELDHPFPYSEPGFVEQFAAYLEAPSSELWQTRSTVLRTLSARDREYLIWQEWVEGFARYVENRIRAAVGLPTNLNGSQPPFSRVSFYASGAKTIEHLTALEPGLDRDLIALYHRLSRWAA